MSRALLKFCSLVLMLSTAYGNDNSSLLKTKSKLKELDRQISQLKQNLVSAHDKRGVLNNEMAVTEKQIGENIKQLRQIQRDIQIKQQKIANLQQHITILNQQLLQQQQLLAKHVVTRYKIGEYQPLKWIINQDEPYTISRLLTFHQYIVQSRQHIIDTIDTTAHSLRQDQAQLTSALEAQRLLQQQLHHHQQQLQASKNYNHAVLQTLDEDIQSKEHVLSEYEHNKENLSQLLKNLSEQSFASQQTPFTKMQRKLPRPIRVANSSIAKMNQGVTFFAGEGSPVSAVYGGKVVFSDWLNGYGLLLIIDHGQGFMTLYAHNQSLFKQKGDFVHQGEQIAAVGHTGGIKQNGLYFEVRQRGKAVSPFEWLS